MYDIIAVTTRGDLSADVLILRAREMGVSVYRFNTEDYPQRVRLRWSLDTGEATLITPTAEVGLSSAKGIWIRRPQWPNISPRVEDLADRAFATQEAVHGLGGLWRVLADKCVSSPDAILASRWKTPQLSLARSLGLSVPDTIVTMDATILMDFAAAGPTVIKAVSDARAVAAGTDRVGRTVALEEFTDLSGIDVAPVLAQRRISKVADWRITLVGGQFFPVRVTSTVSDEVDYRAVPSALLRYEVPTLDGGVAQRLLSFASRYGLRFAAFDLVEDAGGNLWFLECNPAGQWAWLEPATGLDITGALVRLLASGGD